MRVFLLLTLSLPLLLIVPDARGGWGTSCAAPVGSPSTPVFVAPVPETYSWRPFADGDPKQVMLVRDDGSQAGVYVHADKQFYRMDAGVFSKAATPITPPVAPIVTPKPVSSPRVYKDEPCSCGDDCKCGLVCACGKEGSCCKPGEKCPCQVQTNFGLDLDHLAKDIEQYSTNGGRILSRKQAFESLLEGGNLIDDSAWQRVTVGGGTPEQRAGVLKDLDTAPELASWKGKLLIQSYDPTIWAFKPAGYAPGPNDSLVVYVTDSTGGVLSRTVGYPGAKRMAGVLRKADPNYDPAKDPDLAAPPKPPEPPKVPDAPPAKPTTPAEPVASDTMNMVGEQAKKPQCWVCGALGLAALMILRKKKETTP